MVNGPLHAGDITAGEPIYMRSLARARTLRYVKPRGPRYCATSVPRRKSGRSNRLNFERLSNNITSFQPFTGPTSGYCSLGGRHWKGSFAWCNRPPRYLFLPFLFPRFNGFIDASLPRLELAPYTFDELMEQRTGEDRKRSDIVLAVWKIALGNRELVSCFTRNQVKLF